MPFDAGTIKELSNYGFAAIAFAALAVLFWRYMQQTNDKMDSLIHKHEETLKAMADEHALSQREFIDRYAKMGERNLSIIEDCTKVLRAMQATQEQFMKLATDILRRGLS